MRCRPRRDIHVQLPPDDFSVSLNILGADPGQPWLDQYRFDIGRGVIADVADRIITQFSECVARRLAPADEPAAEEPGAEESAAEEAPSGPVVGGSGAAQTVISTAMAQRGKPYVWAASGPGSYDCSGLTAYAYAAAGIRLPHSSAMQSRMGQAVSRDQLQPGDLVFFYSPVSHVGIYIGNGQMVHAPTSGDVVKVAPLMSGFSGARRIAG